MDTHAPGPVRRRDTLTINGQVLEFPNDPVVDVREILNAAGLTPASEHQTILVEKGRTHLLLPEDQIAVADHSQAHLRAFRSGEVFSFTINEISQVWGADQMETDELYTIWPPPNGQDWVLERTDEADVVLRPNSTLSFGPSGVEHIIARPQNGPDHLLVTVLTLSGVFPSEGAVRVKSSELISDILARAARKLNLTETADWAVSVGGRDINPSATFAQEGLAGAIELDWMPREGGGGDA